MPTTPLDRRSFLARFAGGDGPGAGARNVRIRTQGTPVTRNVRNRTEGTPVGLLPALGQVGTTGDAELLGWLASIELAVVAAYDSIIDRADDEVRPTLEANRDHHRDHAAGFAELAGSGRPRANVALVDVLTLTVEELTGPRAALELAAALEDQLAATHGFVLAQVDDPEAAGDVASVVAVECAHSAVLRLLLDDGAESWFPDGAFQNADIARGFSPEAFPR